AEGGRSGVLRVVIQVRHVHDRSWWAVRLQCLEDRLPGSVRVDLGAQERRDDLVLSDGADGSHDPWFSFGRSRGTGRDRGGARSWRDGSIVPLQPFELMVPPPCRVLGSITATADGRLPHP